MADAEIAEEHQKLLWNHGGTSDETFSRGWRYVIGISSSASDYFRKLPRWLAQEYPEVRRIGVLYSGNGTFGREINRGVTESARRTGHSVRSVALSDPFENSDAVLSTLREINAEAVALAGSFSDEVTIMRTRLHWPTTVRATAAVAAGLSN
jgi:branched-chain amino acid transport system substrate-binding protein